MFRFYTTLISLSVLNACQAHMSYEPNSPEELIRADEEQISEETEESKESNEISQNGQTDSYVNQDAGEGKKEAKAEKEVVQKVTKSKPVPPTMKTTEIDFSNDISAAEDVAESTAIIGLLSTRGDSGTVSSVYGSGGLGKSGSGLGGGGTIGNFGKKSMKRGKSGSMPTRVPRNQQLSQYQQPIEKEAPILSDQTTSEEYTDYGVNPFTKTKSDAQSTFSIDVDTASYTIARRKLNSGSLPPFSSVRVEEFVNFFDYNYDTAEASPFTVHLEGMDDPFREDHHILRVGIQGKEFTPQTRPPLRLTFLVDVSGSMSSQDKLPMAQKALHLLVDELDERDSVAIATYAGRISAVLQPTSGADRKSIHHAIDQLSSGGSTAMSSGLDLAYQMAWNSFEKGAENRVVVLSDGDANVGRTSWEQMLKQIKSYADRGVTMSTIGFGMGNYKDTRMEQLANKGDGNNYYIDTFTQAKRVFVEDFQSTMISIARNVKIQVEFDPQSVESYRLIGYENRDIADKDFRNDRVDAGEVGAGHNVTALYELVLADGAKNKNELATVRLRYESPGADKSATERSWEIPVADVQSNPRPSEELRLAYTAATFGEILRRSPYASQISFTDLVSYGSKAQRRGEKDDAELIDLMQKASKLQSYSGVVQR